VSNKLQYRRLSLVACQKRKYFQLRLWLHTQHNPPDKDGQNVTITLRPSSVHILSCLVTTWHARKVTSLL
jgi:hypothetical protein